MALGAYPALAVKVPQVQAPQTNPMQMVGQYADLSNALIGNQVNRQNLAARQAIGQAYQQSIDPQTGQLDINRLMSNVANNPNAAWMAGTVAQQALARQQTQTAIKGQQLDQAMKRNSYAATELGSLVPMGGAITRNDVYSRVGDAINNGIMSTQQGASLTASMPQTDGPELAQWVKQQYGTVLANQQYLQGQVQNLNLGGKQVVGTESPLTNQFTPSAILPNSMSPGEASTPTQIGTTPGGQPIMGTKQQFVNQSQPAGPFGTGRYPGTAPQGGGPQPSGGIAMGLPTGEPQALEENGKFSAQQYNDISANAANVPTQKNILQNMMVELSGPNNFQSGPGNLEWRSTVAGLNRAFGINFDASGVAASENFAKLSQQLANAQTSMLGAGSNEKLEASMNATPNPHISVPGNVQIIHKLLGNQDFVGAWNQAAQAYQGAHGPTSYQSFVADASKWLNPLGFQMHYMSSEERQAELKTMTPGELQTFRQDYNEMAAHGMFDQYQQAPAAAGGAPASAPPATPAAAPLSPAALVPTAP